MRLLVALMLLAASSSLASPQTALVFELTGDAPAEQRRNMTSIIAGRLQRFPSLQVVTGPTLQNLLDAPEAKAAIGDACADVASPPCRERLATAVKAEWLCTGYATVLETTTTIALSMQRTTADSEPVTTTFDINSLDDMSDRLSRAVDVMAENAVAEKPVDAVVAPVNTLPDLRMPLTIGGGVLAGLGVVGIMGGMIPSLLYGAAQGSLVDLRDQHRANPSDDLLNQGKQKRIEAVGYKDAHNHVAVYVLGASIAAVVIGGGGAAAAYFLWPTQNDTAAEVQP